MAWVDDRAWCHPKVANLSDRAFRVWVNGLAYSSGFEKEGYLTTAEQKLVGVTPAIYSELVGANLWEPNKVGIYIHDWDAHNAKRDARRKADRERKRLKRERKRPQDIPQDNPHPVMG